MRASVAARCSLAAAIRASRSSCIFARLCEGDILASSRFAFGDSKFMHCTYKKMQHKLTARVASLLFTAFNWRFLLGSTRYSCENLPFGGFYYIFALIIALTLSRIASMVASLFAQVSKARVSPNTFSISATTSSLE